MADYKRKMGIEEDRDSSAYWREKEARRMNPPDAYDSVRPAGTRARLRAEKSGALKDAALGAAIAPASVALETAMGRSGRESKSPIGAGVEHLAGTGDRLAKSTREAADYIGSKIDTYKSARDDEKGIERELESQTKREARGMKKGGAVSASSRADGIAMRGKTRGKII